MHILLVDDEKEILDLVEIYLKNEGLEVSKALNAEDALTLLSQGIYHLVVLDVMMPGMNGIEALQEIRKHLNVPVIMLSAKSEDIDKIMGLSTGADDYMTKPFNPLELVARIKSQLRRYIYLNTQGSSVHNEDIINIEELQLCPREHLVKIYGQVVNLTPTEYDILLLLASNRGRVFSAEEIFEKVWEDKYFESNNTVMVHIRKIREKIEENPRKPRYIKTVWGVGYKIEK